MSIVVNGSGTITGISTGGLPDGSVDSDTLAANAVVTGKIADGTIAAVDINSAVELGGPSLGTSHVIRTNAQTISENITIASTTNGMSAGPIEIADGYTVTVDGNWSIV